MANAPGQELGRKLTVQSFGWTKGAIQKAVLTNDDDVFLMRVVGIARSTKAYVSRQKGEDGQPLEGYGLRGNWKITSGTNAPSNAGETIPGNLIYLPGYITEMLVDMLQGSATEDVAVETGLDLYARHDEDSATSYVFVARSLTTQDTSALDALEASLKGTPMPQLTGPKK